MKYCLHFALLFGQIKTCTGAFPKKSPTLGDFSPTIGVFFDFYPLQLFLWHKGGILGERL